MSNDAPPCDPVEAPAVMVVAHPPERRRRLGSSGPAQAGAGCQAGCCCCCCCCLHSVGGLIGAAVAPNLGSPEPRSYLWRTSYWDEDFNPRIALPKSGPSAVSLFWWTLLVLVTGGMVFGMLTDGGAGIAVAGIIVLLVFPGLQLGAAVLTAVFLAVSRRPDRGYQLRQLGKIVKGVLVGTALGILVMVIIGLLLSIR